MPETPDQRADRIAAVAVELVTRVRDDQPEDVWRWLAGGLPEADRDALCIVLAAAVPDDMPWSWLTAWTTGDPRRDHRRPLAPHGTPAAYARHRYHGEKPCDACKIGTRAYERERYAARRAAA